VRLQLDGQSTPAVTLSLGVAVFPKHGDTSAAILKAADLALYGAKHAGRDRVCMAT
jgi:diguanylate cyclase (GGDEF)-like protein